MDQCTMANFSTPRDIFYDWKNANENLSKWTLLAIFMRLSTFF